MSGITDGREEPVAPTPDIRQMDMEIPHIQNSRWTEPHHRNVYDTEKYGVCDWEVSEAVIWLIEELHVNIPFILKEYIP